MVHLNQVHKEQLTTVANALPNRASVDVEIFGMEGVPDDIRQQHEQRKTQEYWEEQAQRRAATGNPMPGVANQGVKKAKLGNLSDLKARAAAFKAKKAGGDLGTGSEGATPTADSPGAYMVSSFISPLQTVLTLIIVCPTWSSS